MAAEDGAPGPGRDGIIAAATASGEVDGAEGRRVFRGRPIGTLAGRAGSEATVAHLWGDTVPDGADRVRFPDRRRTQVCFQGTAGTG